MTLQVETTSPSEQNFLNPLQIKSPLAGEIIPIQQVPDPVFAQEILGQGIGIVPTDNIFYAPCDGKVVQLHSAGHAITIETPFGQQILGHIGIDTVSLKGRGFHSFVKKGDIVVTGQKLIEFSIEIIKAQGLSITSVLVVLNESLNNATVEIKPNSNVHSNKEIVMELVVPTEGRDKIVSNKISSDENKFFISYPIYLTLPTGMHARPAARLVKIANEGQSEIFILKGDQEASLKSVVETLSLEIETNDEVKVKATGPDAEAAAAKILSELILIEMAENSKHNETNHDSIQNDSDPKNIQAGVFKAISVSPGQVVGPVIQLTKKTFSIHKQGDSPERELKMLQAALKSSQRELEQLIEQLKKNTQSTTQQDILSAHQGFLEDQSLLSQAEKLINEGLSAAYSWNQVIEVNIEQLQQLKNQHLAARANDLQDVGQRVLTALLGTGDEIEQDLSNTIVIAENLTPSQTMKLGHAKVLGLCSTHGGKTSHVAILARSLGIPCLVGAPKEVLTIANGEQVILDADQAFLKQNPTLAEKQAVQKIHKTQIDLRAKSQLDAHKPATTKDGHTIEVASNINSLEDAKQGISSGHDGVGLLRTEFLFLDRVTPPTIEEQTQVYQEIADTMEDKPLVIRTLDIGGDKPVNYLPLEDEENPFLGIRGIRLSLKHKTIFREQLQAILMTKTKAKLHIMFPMIGLWEEWLEAKNILDEEIKKSAFNPNEVKIGMMIEVPSAAIMAETFAPHVDFFSIGTNDLTQYTLAMDRGHTGLAAHIDGLHPAVLQLIHQTVVAAHKHQKWVGVCGGIAGEDQAIPILLGLGVDELSVSSPSVPLIKTRVRELDYKTCQALAKKALTFSTSKEVRQLLAGQI